MLLKGNPYGQDHLQIIYNGTEYVMTHLLNSEFDDEVYSFAEPNRQGNPDLQIDILGDFWSEALVHKDFSYVFKAFKEFW